MIRTRVAIQQGICGVRQLLGISAIDAGAGIGAARGRLA
jgi:hypothetical protein